MMQALLSSTALKQPTNQGVWCRLCSAVEAGPTGRTPASAALDRLLPAMLHNGPVSALAAWFAGSIASSRQLQQQALACLLPHLAATFRFEQAV